MNIKVVKKKGETVSFILEGVTPAFANALRRTMVSDVPTMAVDYADFEDNNGILYDEIIAQRLGFIPLKCDPEKFNFTEECKCKGKGCPSCQAVFAIEKTGPCTVYSGDMKPSNKAVQPTSPKFPIATLQKGQTLKLVAIARKGTGQRHARWQAANAAYQYYPELVESGNKAAVSKCPKGCLKASGSKVVLSDPLKCNLCMACEPYGVKIKGRDDKFIFTVESVSGLEPAYIVSKAAQILTEKADEFKKQASKL